MDDRAAKQIISTFASKFLFPLSGSDYMLKSMGFGPSYIVKTDEQKVAVAAFLDKFLLESRIVICVAVLAAIGVWLGTHKVDST